MRRRIITGAVALGLAATVAAPAQADTAVTLGPATATAVGSWVKPTGCSQLPVTYTGIPAGAYASIHVLDAATRSDVGSTILTSSDPRDGRANVQVCSFRVEDTTSLVLSLDVTGLGVADSQPFAWSPRPGTVRCVNKRTYQIREFAGKACPKGWVRR